MVSTIMPMPSSMCNYLSYTKLTQITSSEKDGIPIKIQVSGLLFSQINFN